MADSIYQAKENRYTDVMKYERAGRSGILLPRISLGLWQNFGAETPFAKSREILLHAFDRGIVSFDLANNYGKPYGSAEETFGRVMMRDLRPYRDELFIATKAGYDMWPGPYGNWGSRKYLMASLDQSLKRMHIDYVDIFYSHRYDPESPIEETLQALVDTVRQGKALYVGISRWPLDKMEYATEYLKAHDTPCLLFQNRLNLFDQSVTKNGLLEFVESKGIGFIAFSTLAEGMLTDKYLHGVPVGSRADRGWHLTKEQLTPEVLTKVARLNEIAKERGESLAQMATAWVLNNKGVTSVIAGCSSVNQLDETIDAVNSPVFTSAQLSRIRECVQTD